MSVAYSPGGDRFSAACHAPLDGLYAVQTIGPAGSPRVQPTTTSPVSSTADEDSYASAPIAESCTAGVQVSRTGARVDACTTHTRPSVSPQEATAAPDLATWRRR
jgi:hypothetical protein